MGESSSWWQDGIIYQIYPRSFCDSNGDGIGDLPGITSRLDYLSELGIDAIWLSPIYPSPNVDFGYDVSNYTAIDPVYGSLQDFDALLEQAHQREVRIILDLVLNHTSDQHPWFQASRSSRDNPYRDWYIWSDGKRGGPPNNWESVFGGRGWEFDPATQQYYFHMFYKEQPDLNWNNPDVRQAMLGVLRFWLERGVDGFRLDVFNAYFKDAALTDNPPTLGLRGFDRQRHIYDMDRPELHPFLHEMRALLDAYPGRYAVGETFLSTPAKAAGYCSSDQLHAAFNFAMAKSRWNPQRFLRAIQGWEAALGPERWPNLVLGNHDLPRIATRYFHSRLDERLKVAAALLLTLRGTPFIYYGEEIGMCDISLRYRQIQDRVGKRYWPFNKGRDGCRSPMQWDGSSNAGFTGGTAWLPVHPQANERNVLAEDADPSSLLNFYRRLIEIRRKTPALLRGKFTPLIANHAALVYQREELDVVVLVALNFSKQPQMVPLASSTHQRAWRMLISNRRTQAPDLTSGLLNLKPDEALVLVS
ncbi:MAG: alpha-glucosidase [Anaerolineaceae bacterium]|nr:alpha-glucosidase [Anaerolineaceae bacterium]